MKVLFRFILGLILILTITPAFADDRGVTVKEKSGATAAPVKTFKTTYYALVIGNDLYLNLPHLHTAMNDAREVNRVLTEKYSFRTKLLLNATRDDILDAINSYRMKLTEKDSFLIYYAGHGEYDKVVDKAYWLPVDAKANNPTHWIMADDITSNIKRIASKHVLIVSDSCYSGALTRSATIDLNKNVGRGEFLTKMMDRASRTLMASGGNEPVSDAGGKDNHSVFASALLTALKEADKPSFTAEELFHNRIKAFVAGRSEQVPQYGDIRNSGHEGGDFVFQTGSIAEANISQDTSPAVSGNSTNRLYIVVRKETIEEIPFNGFNTQCDGYGDSGIKYTSPEGSVTIPWKDIEYILPAFGEGKLVSGVNFKTDTLLPKSCTDGFVQYTKDKLVTVLGYQQVNRQEIRLNLNDIDVIAFSKAGLKMGKSDFLKFVSDKDTVGKEWIDKGLALMNSENYEGALSAFNKAVEINPNNPWAYIDKGWALNGLGNYDQAIKEFNRAVDIDPQIPWIYVYRAQSYICLGNYQQGLLDVDKVTSLDATISWAYINRGWAYLGLGKNNEAIADLDKAAQMDPKNLFIYLFRAWAHNALGNKRQALEDFDKSLDLAPNSSFPHWNIATYYALGGEKEKSIAELRKTISINGTFKQKAKTDKNFQSLWNDSDFKKLVE